ncbi:MAG: hypothetical protein ACP6IY_12120 [Promethearchaeia archaeon]
MNIKLYKLSKGIIISAIFLHLLLSINLLNNSYNNLKFFSSDNDYKLEDYFDDDFRNQTLEIKCSWYNFPDGVEESYLGEKWIRIDLFTSGGGETGCCFLDNNVLVISRNKGWTHADEPLDFYFYYLNGSTIHFEHYPNTEEGEELWYGSYAITNGARFGASMNRLIISNGYYCDGDPYDPINTYGNSNNWHYNASYKHGDVHSWSSFPLIGDDVPLIDPYDKQDIVTTSGVTYAVSYGNNPSTHTLHIGKNNGTIYTDDLEGLGATWPSVGGGTHGNPVIFAWMRDAGGVGIMYQARFGDEDTESPRLVNAKNKTVELGSSNNYISWNWTDDNPDSYIIKLEDVVIDQGVWTSGVPIELPVSASEIGVKNYLCIVNDTKGNYNQSVIRYEVKDTTAPNINNPPSDIYYNEGNTGNLIIWDWDDLAPSYYNITRDSTLIRQNNWNSSLEDIIINVDGLSAGTYIYRCSVRDSSGNWAYDEVSVIVSSNLSIFGSEDFNYTVGSEGNLIQWTATTGANPDGYKIYQNHELIETGNWVSGVPIIINIDGLAVGQYEFNCSVKDDSGASVFDLINVIVIADTQAPSLVNASSNMEIDESKSGIILNWTWTDINPNKYIIKRNGILVDIGTWVSDAEINYATGNLSIGEYEFICIVNDTYSNINQHIIIINVTDLQPPLLIDKSSDIIIELGSKGNTINWTWIDLRPDFYKILRDDQPIGNSGQWFSGVQISLVVDGLNLGEYIFKCVVNDTYGNVNSHAIKVSVIDTINPKYGNFGKSFDDCIVFGVITEFTFWCEWYDASNITAYLYVNKTAYIATDIVGDNYSLTITLTEAGIYEYTWIAFDEKNNYNHTMPINTFELVLDTNKPIYSKPEIEEKAKSLEIYIEVTDGILSSGIQYVILYYGVDKENWNLILMDLDSARNETGQYYYTYKAIISKSNSQDVLYYFIEISDNHANLVKTKVYEYKFYKSHNEQNYGDQENPLVDTTLIGIGSIALSGGALLIFLLKKRKSIRLLNEKRNSSL